jgi:hypothetical protein
VEGAARANKRDAGVERRGPNGLRDAESRAMIPLVVSCGLLNAFSPEDGVILPVSSFRDGNPTSLSDSLVTAVQRLVCVTVLVTIKEA